MKDVGLDPSQAFNEQPLYLQFIETVKCDGGQFFSSSVGCSRGAQIAGSARQSVLSVSDPPTPLDEATLRKLQDVDDFYAYLCEGTSRLCGWNSVELHMMKI
jgi:hypothetical protein